MDTFLPFFITLLASLILSTLSKRYSIPWVITLIIAGVIIGPFGLKLFQSNETIDFFANTGLVLLMFMVGLETKPGALEDFKVKMFALSFVNGVIPFLAGVFISKFFGLNTTASVLIGIIFLSSSIAVVVPSLETSGLIKSPLGVSVITTSMIQDIASLVLLSIFLQTEQTLANLPLYIFYPMIILILVLLKTFLPRIQDFVLSRASDESDFFHRDIRAVLLVLFGIVIVFELLGLHPIIAGFFAGLVLAGSVKSEILLGKIRAISYGIFIPTFFIVVGTQIDISVVYQYSTGFYFTVAIVVGSILSKFFSGTTGALMVGFNDSQSLFFGASSIPQLSTTLAATFSGRQLGLISDEVVTSMVILSMISTVIGPLMMKVLESQVLSKKDIEMSTRA